LLLVVFLPAAIILFLATGQRPCLRRAKVTHSGHSAKKRRHLFGRFPKNTCSGQKFRIAKQGLKKGDKTGDLIVTVSIEISKDLSDDEIRLYEQLKKLSKDNVRKNFGYGS
jgi:hypothetical protein